MLSLICIKMLTITYLYCSNLIPIYITYVSIWLDILGISFRNHQYYLHLMFLFLVFFHDLIYLLFIIFPGSIIILISRRVIKLPAR